MTFLNPIVISEKILYNDSLLKTKALTASMFVHGALLAATLFIYSQHPITIPEEKPVLISLADYAPSSSNESINLAKHDPIRKSTPITHKDTPTPIKTKTTPQEIPSHTPMVSPEALPQPFPVHPSVAPSDQKPITTDLLHSNQKTIADDSPHDAHPAQQANDLQKPNVSSDEVNGATLGRIRIMIENALTYPSIARKLRLEGTVVVTFMLKPDGFVEKVEILSTSGSSLLDTKARQTVIDLSGEFPTLPKTVFLKIPIAFSLKNVS
ncbi:MAG: TonB family protein [Sulfuricurvum sp.]|nr:TonB family protein [Sulfuricurvum sp.]